MVFYSKLKHIVCAAVLVTSVAVAQEAPTVSLTVDEAVAYADANSRTLKSSALDLEIKKRAADLSWNQFLPSVNMSATVNRSNKVSSFSLPGMPDVEPTEADHWTAVGSVSIGWNFSFALVDGLRIIKKNYEAGLISWDQARRENELQIRKLFYGLLLQQETLAIQQQTLENARLRVTQAEINYRNGLIPELSLLQAQVAYENQRPSVLKMEQSLKQQLALFGFMLGMPSDTQIILTGEIEPVFIDMNADELIQQYGLNTPDIAALEKNLEIMELNLSVQNLQAFTPALSLSWGFQPLVSDIDSNWLDTYSDGGAFSATLAWNLTNMLPFSSNRQQAKDTKVNIEKLQVSLDTLRESTELDIRTQVDTLTQSRASIEAAAGSIALAQKSYDMTLAAYRNGTTELLDVRDAEDQLNQAKLGLLNEKYTYLTSLLDLEYMLNVSLSD